MTGRVLLVDRLWPTPSGLRPRLLRATVFVVVGAALLTLGAWIIVPTERSISMQNLAVLALALAYGPWLGGTALAAHLALGMLGLPAYPEATVWRWNIVLSAGFGHFVGAFLAVLATGSLAVRGMTGTWVGRIGAPALGQGLIYAASILWLTAYLNKGSGYPFGAMVNIALVTETLPFLVADAAKVLAAAGIVWGIERRLETRQRS